MFVTMLRVAVILPFIPLLLVVAIVRALREEVIAAQARRRVRRPTLLPRARAVGRRRSRCAA
jgi:hypothetical protein